MMENPEAISPVEPSSLTKDSDCVQPPVNPEAWPQSPILMRPNPKSGTKILGIRKENSADYLWTPGSATTWWEELRKEWGSTDEEDSTTIPEAPRPEISSYCERTVILPINNGNEPQGESLVADFESDLFRGTLMMRLRHAEGTTKEQSDDTKGYFADVPHRYQAVIRGNFKDSIPFTDLLTGTKLARPCGNLPSYWVLWTANKVLSYFAPQLKVNLETDTPSVLSPLGSTARVIEVDSKQPTDFLGDERAEPNACEPIRSLTGQGYEIDCELERSRARKKNFDQLYIEKDKSESMWTDPSKTYTMEFLQHLFDYQKFTIDLGTMSYDMNDVLQGQPLQFMACQDENCDKQLWSFELWNEALCQHYS